MIKGSKMKAESRLKLSLSHKAFYANGGKHPMLGKRHSEETKNRWSILRKGIEPINKGKKGLWKPTKEQKEKHRMKLLGHKTSLETKRKISESQKKEKSYWWRGGLTNEPYPVDWGQTLRRSIRERDHYTCQICNFPQGDRAHDVHHIDYHKKNCDPKNLITLCHSCHSRTNADRKYWMDFFINKGFTDGDKKYK